MGKYRIICENLNCGNLFFGDGWKMFCSKCCEFCGEKEPCSCQNVEIRIIQNLEITELELIKKHKFTCQIRNENCSDCVFWNI